MVSGSVSGIVSETWEETEMCYGDCNCFMREMKKDGMTYTEAKVLLNELRDKVASGELEPEEALASAGLDSRFLMALQE